MAKSIESIKFDTIRKKKNWSI